MSAMNFCPPNPGSTVIISTISTSSTNGNTDSTGVLGLIPIPTLNSEIQQSDHSINNFCLVVSATNVINFIFPT